MRSARIAEWILALFLEPDRAAAYTGDLMEESAEHSFLWFWSSVARLAIMRFWYDVSESPFYLAGVLLRASILNVALDMSIILGSTVLMAPAWILVVGVLHTGLGVPISALDGLGRWIGLICGIAVSFLGPFFTGRWAATKTPRREMVASIALCAAQPLLYKHYLLTHDATMVAPELPDYLIGLTTYAGFLIGGARTRLRSVAR